MGPIRLSSDARDRWNTAEGHQLTQEVWRRLVAGESLRSLPLGENEGRLDLRGIQAPVVFKNEGRFFRNWALHEVRGRLEFRNVQFEDLDFTGSALKHAQFFNSRIKGCRFDHADCEGLGVRATDVTETSFVGANLRDAVLGPWYKDRGNKYKFVDFSSADMRGLISTTAAYSDCNFSEARLDKVDFQSSSFIRCRFAGEMREVLFYSKTFNSKKKDPNPMEDVDFTQAKLHWVEFRGLNLDRVRFPQDDDHILIKNYRCVLGRALNALRDHQSQYAGRLRAILELEQKWLGPMQEVGLVRRLDFRERWGKEGEEFAVELMRDAERKCAMFH